MLWRGRHLTAQISENDLKTAGWAEGSAHPAFIIQEAAAVKKKSIKYHLKREWILHVMLLPAVILLLVFAYYPMLGVLISFQDFIPGRGS